MNIRRSAVHEAARVLDFFLPCTMVPAMVATGAIHGGKGCDGGAFQGIAAVPLSVQVQFFPGMVNLLVVGLPDKAVAESRERPTAQEVPREGGKCRSGNASRQTLVRLFGIGHMLKNCQDS
jgi:hypothetical protein